MLLLILATATLICCVPASPTTAAASTIDGASLATCTPEPCLPASGLETVALEAVGNDDGSVSARTYGVYRPQHLSADAPAVLVFYGGGNCGVVPASRFAQLSVANRFVVVYMAVPCGRESSWEKRNVDSVATTTPDDEPYVTAVVDDITRCPGECVDPQRIYAAGMSSGGSMVADVMCDPRNSPLFRGYMIDSSSLQLFEGKPHCPSVNRSFFVLLALGNVGADTGLYYDTSPNPHLDVPAFADWAARRLGCTKAVRQGSLGSPVTSTLTYTYEGPCAYASEGSPAVLSLGIEDGAHGWPCQDSDAGASAGACMSMPTPPGLDANGLPKTNGLFTEEQFWNFVADGTSSSEPAPPSSEEVPPPAEEAPPPPEETPPPPEETQPSQPGEGSSPLPGSSPDEGAPLLSPPIPSASRSGGTPAWVALGDDYAAGAGNRPYLAGSDTPADRCHRSALAYPTIAAARLGIAPPALHACAGASVAAFYRAKGGDHEPPQLSWVNSAVGLVTVSVGWNDASMSAAISRCGRVPARCRGGLSRSFRAAISSLGSPSRDPRSLRRLFATIASAAPKARVIALGYPRPFPASPPSGCHVGGLRLTRATMRSIDAAVGRLDRTIGAAAAAAHVVYGRGSYRAFAGHELCTPSPALNAALDPNRLGQAALAALVANTRG